MVNVQTKCVRDLNVRPQVREASASTYLTTCCFTSAGKRRSLRVRDARWSVETWQWERDRGRRKSGFDEWRESEPLITGLTPRPQTSSRVCGLHSGARVQVSPLYTRTSVPRCALQSARKTHFRRSRQQIYVFELTELKYGVTRESS